jgi:hypothetical protein
MRPRPVRPGGADGHSHGRHAWATCRILSDTAQAGQPALAPATIAHGLRAILGAGAAVADTTVRLYTLPVGLLHDTAVLALVEMGLYAHGRVDATLGAYLPHGSVILDGAAPPDRAHAAVGSRLALPARGVHRRVAVRIGWEAHCKTVATCVAAAQEARGKAPNRRQQP